MRQSLLGDTATKMGAPGSPAYKVLLEQLNSSCEELEVRKEEVLILRSQLVSQKEAMHHKVGTGFLFHNSFPTGQTFRLIRHLEQLFFHKGVMILNLR